LPYCRKCGTQLEENAQFCHKCGTQVVIFSAAPPAKSAPESPVSTPIIVLIAVIAVAVIVSFFVFSTFYPLNSNRAHPSNPANQTSVTKLSFNLQKGVAQANVLAQNLTVKTGFNAVSAATMQRTNSLSPQP
jgi:flagellar basal body-associated protein FliL